MIPAQIARLVPRLATPFDAEVIATRDAIGRLLQAAGLDWHDLAKACVSISALEGVATPSSRPAATRASFGDMARACRDLDRGQLTLKERAFIADMCGKGFAFRPSPRQAAWLGDILDRLHGRAAA